MLVRVHGCENGEFNGGGNSRVEPNDCVLGFVKKPKTNPVTPHVGAIPP